MNIAIIGYGKMGRTIEQIALTKGHQIVLKINVDNLQDFTAENLAAADVAIEFSQPESAFNNITTCLKLGCPVISGTTGWLDRMKEAKTICETHQTGFVYASNFSIGVNIFFAINQRLAEMMNAQEQYAVEMEEIHHIQKLDAPSGTAITLAEDILEKVNRKDTWINEATSTPSNLPIISKRIDKVPGTHQISYISPVDTIEIKHTAHSREGFARGAILAAEWIVGKKGCFSMSDVLDL